MEFRQFEVSDIEAIKASAVDETVRDMPDDILRAGAELNLKCGPAFTYFKDGKIIGAAGIRIVRKGVGHLWAMFSQEIRNCKKDFFRSTITMLDIVIKEFGIKKLRTESRIGFPTSQRFLEHLMFDRQRRKLIKRNYYLYTLEC